MNLRITQIDRHVFTLWLLGRFGYFVERQDDDDDLWWAECYTYTLRGARRAARKIRTSESSDVGVVEADVHVVESA